MVPNMDASASWFSYAHFLLMMSCFYYMEFSHPAMDTISVGEELTASNTIISAGGYFELGFFLPENSTNLYLGIWFKKASSRAIVWVANRDHPLTTTSSAVLTISNNGNLVILDKESNSSYMLTNVSSNNNSSAVLLDSGNLVLRDENTDSLWQSFDYPTDNWLLGMKLGYDKTTGKFWSINSWRNDRDPSHGDFTLEHNPTGSQWSFIMKKEIEKYWSYWISAKPNSEWIMEIGSHKVNYNYVNSNDNISYVVFNVQDKGFFLRYFIDASGILTTFFWSENNTDWTVHWSSSSSQCGSYAYCGSFGICNMQSHALCSCLTGFKPYSTKMENYGGCVRKTTLQCNNTNATGNGFVLVSTVALPDNEVAFTSVKSMNDCRSACLSNCSCTAYSYNDNLCLIWAGDLLNLQQLSNNDNSGRDLYIKLAASELAIETYKKRKLWIIVTSTVASTLITSAIFLYWRWTKRNRQEGMDLLSFDFSMSLGGSETAGRNRLEKCTEAMEIPVFSFSSIYAATNGFSSANKLGEGGFGPVYKGKLLNGHEVAVKRLSRRSGQGWEELKNEAKLVAKLQHKNLVKLLGCCIDGDEKILIYEYLSNKSLDIFLFGPTQHKRIDWGTRIGIIEGIAQGLLYLHQYSRLQIIHRDLKASNILLDKDMNPKISDFGIARMNVCGKETQATNSIVGTYGYMSPEYALEGIFSIKSDVFSFGVLLLEILSGKKNTGFYSKNSLNLVGYSWDLWKSNRPLDMMDPVLGNTHSPDALRYMNIALLCVEENPSDRPTMSDVVSLLSNKSISSPSPRKPAFSSQNYSTAEVCSVNEITVTTMAAR